MHSAKWPWSHKPLKLEKPLYGQSHCGDDNESVRIPPGHRLHNPWSRHHRVVRWSDADPAWRAHRGQAARRLDADRAAIADPDGLGVLEAASSRSLELPRVLAP